MRHLVLAIVLVAVPLRARADDDVAPALAASWDLRPAKEVSLRLGAATLEDVSIPVDGYVVLLAALRVAWNPHRDVELGFGMHLAAFSGDGDGGPTFDPGFGIPTVRLAWARAIGHGLRLGVVGQTSLGATDSTTSSPADLASGAFLLDEAITWTQTWTGLGHGDVQWSDGRTTYQGTLGLAVYSGRAVEDPVTVLRMSGGVARRLEGCWTASAEALLLTDLQQEALTEPYDVVPVVTVGVRHAGEWDLGGALSYAWVDTAPGVGRPGVVFVFNATREL